MTIDEMIELDRLPPAPPQLRRITEIPCSCAKCAWRGVTGDCEPDDDGCLVCPKCNHYRVDIHYNEHERNPG